MNARYIGMALTLLLGLTPTFLAKQPDSSGHTERRPAIEFVSSTRTAGPEEPASTTANTVDVTVAPMGSLVFSPSAVTILVGDTVRWTWANSFHTVTSGAPCTSNSAFCSPSDTNCSSGATSNMGDVYTHTFNQAGTFAYFCAIHCFSNMRGSVQVLAPFINISSLNNDITGFTINGQTTATTVHTTVTLTTTSDLTTGFGNPVSVAANASGAFTLTDGSGMNPRFYRFSYP